MYAMAALLARAARRGQPGLQAGERCGSFLSPAAMIWIAEGARDGNRAEKLAASRIPTQDSSADVFGNINQHRTGPARSSNVKRLTDYTVQSRTSVTR